jgi:hypothetical protein
LVTAIVSEKKNIKKHFEFTYNNFGIHILFISCLAGLFMYHRFYILWFLVLFGIAFYIYLKAMKKKSFYFLLLVTFYTYIALSYVVINILEGMSAGGVDSIYLGFMYFILSAIGLVRLLMIFNRKIKTDDRLQPEKSR